MTNICNTKVFTTVPLDTMPLAEIDSALASAIQSGDGETAVELLIQHPDGVFGKAFNDRTQGSEDQADTVLTYTRRTLARMIVSRQVRSVQELRRAMFQVLTVNVHHFRHRVQNQPHNKTVLLGSRVDGLPSPATPPETSLLQAELLPVLLTGARQLGLLGCRVIREFRCYEESCGTRKGAYPFLASLAVTDAADRIIAIRRPQSAFVLNPVPSKRLIRQVRSLHINTLRKLHEIANSLGFDVPYYD